MGESMQLSQLQERQHQQSDIINTQEREELCFPSNFDDTKQLFYQNRGAHQIKLLEHSYSWPNIQRLLGHKLVAQLTAKQQRQTDKGSKQKLFPWNK